MKNLFFIYTLVLSALLFNLTGCGHEVTPEPVAKALPPTVSFSDLYPDLSKKCDDGTKLSCKPMQKCRCYPLSEL